MLKPSRRVLSANMVGDVSLDADREVASAGPLSKYLVDEMTREVPLHIRFVHLNNIWGESEQLSLSDDELDSVVKALNKYARLDVEISGVERLSREDTLDYLNAPLESTYDGDLTNVQLDYVLGLPVKRAKSRPNISRLDVDIHTSSFELKKIVEAHSSPGEVVVVVLPRTIDAPEDAGICLGLFEQRAVMVVSSVVCTPELFADVVAHEFGHHAELGHREDDNPGNTVEPLMSPSIKPGDINVASRPEARRMRSFARKLSRLRRRH